MFRRRTVQTKPDREGRTSTYELGPNEMHRATARRPSWRGIDEGFAFFALVLVILSSMGLGSVALGSVGPGVLLLLIGGLVFGFYIIVRGYIALSS